MSVWKYLNEQLLKEETPIDKRRQKLYENAVGDTMTMLDLFSNDISEEDEVEVEPTDTEEPTEEPTDTETPTEEPKQKSGKNPETIDTVKKLLASGEDFSASGEEFRDSLMKSKHKEMLTDYSPEELSKMKLVKLPNYDIGYALKDFKDPQGKVHPNGELVAVHNNEPSVGGIGDDLMVHAIKHGAMALDHFDVGILSKLYQKYGFKEYERYNYDPQYDPDGSFKNKYGEVDVVYRMK